MHRWKHDLTYQSIRWEWHANFKQTTSKRTKKNEVNEHVFGEKNQTEVFKRWES